MDIDDALKATGAFGTVQKRLFWLHNAVSFVNVFMILPITFVGALPDVECVGDGEQCVLYRDGKCTVEYQFHSFVKDVSIKC